MQSSASLPLGKGRLSFCAGSAYNGVYTRPGPESSGRRPSVTHISCPMKGETVESTDRHRTEESGRRVGGAGLS